MLKPLRAPTACLHLLLLLPTALPAQTFQLTATDVARHIDLALPAGTYHAQAAYVLVNTDEPTRKLPAQVVSARTPQGAVDPGKYRLLVSLPAAPQGDTTASSYRLERLDRTTPPAFSFAKTELQLQLTEQVASESSSRSVWQYNFSTIVDESVPRGDARRERSCYVHPLWGLHGEILTDDFPKDHYHHHGIFWTWPYVAVGDKTYDLWMSTDIRQQFNKWLATDTGPVAARLGVENDWLVDSQRVATERVWLTTYRSDAASQAIDIAIHIQAADRPVTLQGRQQKSYGGLTLRYDVSPRKDATVRIPGKSLGFGFESAESPDLLNTPLPWADLTTRIPGSPQRSGAAVFIHPQHPDYPPTWLTRTYGALCVGWPGVESHEIAAGESIELNYRVWVHAAELDPAQLDRHYKGYALSD